MGQQQIYTNPMYQNSDFFRFGFFSYFIPLFVFIVVACFATWLIDQFQPPLFSVPWIVLAFSVLFAFVFALRRMLLLFVLSKTLRQIEEGGNRLKLTTFSGKTVESQKSIVDFIETLEKWHSPLKIVLPSSESKAVKQCFIGNKTLFINRSFLDLLN